ncbi:hypothetical protein AW27_023645 [Streptomyces sp. PCS3-D2]|uniref:hypothetical protein n=1 Tax=Streptomyces sp. PCS3-D2 TaxID=1460244 RepID=UPI00044CA178|nr:hypothetical protein [Streptomyces sp. PCS3-D2]WKV74239.1 hypothetical protein AW27_023645 [Streptomyces sp. PCS3-D2]
MNVCLCRTELQDGHLCTRCRNATAGRLRRLPVLYRLLQPELQPAAGSPSYGRVRLVEAPMPAMGLVLSLRGPGGIVSVLEDWWSAMQASRCGSAPVITGTYDERAIRAAKQLTFHLDYVAEWEQGTQLAREIRSLDETAMDIVCPHDTLERGTLLGPCPAEQVDGTVCGATLRHYRSSMRRVTCPWCSSVYPMHSWARLKAWIDHDEHDAA